MIWIIRVCLAVMLGFAPAVSAQERPERDMIQSINEMRGKRALSPLIVDPRLAKAAQRLARNAAERRRGATLCQAVEDAGFPCASIGSLTSVAQDPVPMVASSFFTDGETRPIVATQELRYAGVGRHSVEDPRFGDLDYWVVLLGNPPKPATRNWRREVLKEVNRFRATHGLRPLRLAPLLNEAAQRHADDMAYRDYFAHEAPNGTGPGDRAASAGYRFQTVLENLAAGQQTPREAVEGWKNSPGHRRAMLNRKVTEAGIGYRFLSTDRGRVRSFHYWAMSMALPR